jgi:hypothetical protein
VTTALWVLVLGVIVIILWDLLFRNRKGPL